MEDKHQGAEWQVDDNTFFTAVWLLKLCMEAEFGVLVFDLPNMCLELDVRHFDDSHKQGRDTVNSPLRYNLNQENSLTLLLTHLICLICLCVVT